jgi:hypothetical protein
VLINLDWLDNWPDQQQLTILGQKIHGKSKV